MATWIELLAWFQAFEERLLWVSSPLWGQREDGVYNQRHTFVAPTTRIMRYSCYQWQARSTRTCRGLHHPHRACNDTGADYIIFWLIDPRKKAHFIVDAVIQSRFEYCGLTLNPFRNIPPWNFKFFGFPLLEQMPFILISQLRPNIKANQLWHTLSSIRTGCGTTS